MQMQDALRHAQGGTAVADLAAAFEIAPAAAEAAMRAVAAELAWHLEKNTISRAGLANLVEALGHGHHSKYLEGGDVFRDEAVRADGKAILGHILGSKDRSRAVAARAARQAGLGDEVVRSMLPGIAAVTMGGLAMRANGGLGRSWVRCPRSAVGAAGTRMPTLPTSCAGVAGPGPTRRASSGAWCAGCLRARVASSRAGPCAGICTSCSFAPPWRSCVGWCRGCCRRSERTPFTMPGHGKPADALARIMRF